VGRATGIGKEIDKSQTQQADARTKSLLRRGGRRAKIVRIDSLESSTTGA